MSYVNIPSEQTLQREITATNAIHKIVNELGPKINEVLRPFRGQKVLKKTPYRSLTQKAKQALEPLLDETTNNYHGLTIYVDCNYTSMFYVTVKLRYEAEPNAWNYIERDIISGILNDGILKDEDIKLEPLKDDYNFSEVLEKFLVLKRLQSEVDEVKKSLHQFLYK
jgi:hypothetical protein